MTTHVIPSWRAPLIPIGNEPRLKPTFFIAGAPKCGTTALSEYLRAHPRIFVSTPKEPNFFSTDLPGLLRTESIDDYLGLFAEAPSTASIAGEASATYLFSRVALDRIRAFAPAAKIISMLRDPVELAHALHSQLLYNRTEDQPDFEVAWGLQKARAEGQRIPRLCREPLLLQYRKVAMLGAQTRRLLETFPRDQVKFIVYNDFVDDPLSRYKEVLAFLGIPYDGRKQFPVVNANRGVHLDWLARFTQHPPRVLMTAAKTVKRLGMFSRIGFLDPLRRANSQPLRRAPLPNAFRQELTREFEADIALLSTLLNRDFSPWLAPRETTPRSAWVEPRR